MPREAPSSQSSAQIKLSQEARTHARYLLQGDDYAIPSECPTCRELKAAGVLVEMPSARKPIRWKVRPDAV